MSPKLSFIIPVYNVEPYISKCLASIEEQEFHDWEAILIDDGSTDNSPSICDEYAYRDSRFRVIHKENGGVSTARNAGLDVAKGQWVWFVDPDDWITLDAVGLLVETVTNNDCDVVFFGIDYYDETLERIGFENREPIVGRDKDEAIAFSDYPPQNYLVRKDIIDDKSLRYSVGIPTGEDLEFQYKCLMLCNKPISLNYRLYNCLRRHGSAMHNEKTLVNNANSSIVILEHLVDFIIEHKIEESGWLSARINRTFKSVLSSNAIIERYTDDLQMRFRKAYEKLYEYGFREFSDLALVVGRIDMRIYAFVIKLRKFLRK